MRGRTARKRRKEKENNVTVACQKKYIILRQWMKRCGSAPQNSLVPCLFTETGRGLKATRAIKEGELIVALPERLLITVQVVLESCFGDLVKRWKPILTPQRALTMFLVFENHKSEESFWYPYMQSLPATFTTPAYFTQQELKLLPVHVYSKAVVQYSQLQKVYQDLYSFLNLQSGLFPIESFSFESFKWAWFVVNTRSVYLKTPESPYLDLTPEETNMALAPFLDLLNHSAHAKVQAGLNSTTGCYEMVTFDSYKKHEQVFISYGPHDNKKLFLEYGFTVAGNPHNVYEVLFEDIMSLEEDFQLLFWEKKKNILTENDFTRGLTCSLDGVSWKLHTALKIIAMTWDELKSWKIVYQENTVSEGNENKVQRMVVWLLQKALEGTQNLCQPANTSLSEHKRLAQNLVEDDRSILQSCLRLLS